MFSNAITVTSSLSQAFKLATIPILISFVVTPVRFMLELSGVPEIYIFLIGLLWLTLALAIYWGIKLHNERNPYRLLLLTLFIFSPISRIPVFILWWITKTWELGTHYDIFDNWSQALIGQLFYVPFMNLMLEVIVLAVN